MGGKGSGGKNKKSIENHILDKTFRKDRHLKEYLRYKDNFNNDKNELIEILNEMEKLCLGETNGKPNIYEKRYKYEDYYFTETVMTKQTERKKKELENKFVSQWNFIKEKYGNRDNIFDSDVLKYLNKGEKETYIKYQYMFYNLHFHLMFSEYYDENGFLKDIENSN